MRVTKGIPTDTVPAVAAEAMGAKGSGLPRSLFFFCLLYGGMTVLAGVLSFKQVSLGPLAVEAGIFAFLCLVVLTGAVHQVHGAKAADRLVLWGFVPLVVSMLLIGLVLALPQAATMPAENVAAFETVLAQTPRIMAAGPAAYFISLFLNIRILSALRKRGQRDSNMWLMVRAGIASALSQAVDTLIFITLAFYGQFPIGSLIAGQLVAKVVLSLVLVPPMIALAVRLAHYLDAGGNRTDPA